MRPRLLICGNGHENPRRYAHGECVACVKARNERAKALGLKAKYDAKWRQGYQRPSRAIAARPAPAPNVVAGVTLQQLMAGR